MATRKIEFPKGGIKGGPNYVGPFCCDGETAIVEFAYGQPAGYVHFFTWEGQALNVGGNRSVAQTLKVLVSGVSNFNDPWSVQVQAEVTFPVQSLRAPGASKEVRAGALNFKVVSSGAEVLESGGQAYFYMDTPRLVVIVSPAD